MNKTLSERLKTLPNSPGVYFHLSESGEIIYVGKAAVLKNRVRQYFQKSKDYDTKTQALISEINDTDWIETESEIDALFLESEMVKRYMPRFNILLRDDKSQMFVRIDMKSEWPHISFTRNPSDDGAKYIGPFYNGVAVRKALRYLRKVFPYYTKPPVDRQRDLDIHLGLSPKADITSEEYKKNLKKLIKYIEGGRTKIVAELEKDMKRAAKRQEFEVAAEIRNKLRNLGELQRRIMFGDSEFMNISKDFALTELKQLLKLKKEPHRIEGYDISHMSGRDVVASMVVFTNGVSDRAEYRKFKTRIEHNNDFYNMNETITRRLSEKNIKAWGKPDLMLIDGGKGQLDSAIQARNSLGLKFPMIGLAKKQEEIVVHLEKSFVEIDTKKMRELGGNYMQTEKFVLINLPNDTHIIKLLQRIRDESHRFAVSYHTTLKRARQTVSVLDDIKGVGPKTKKKLIKEFGSVRGVMGAPADRLEKTVGPVIAKRIISMR